MVKTQAFGNPIELAAPLLFGKTIATSGRYLVEDKWRFCCIRDRMGFSSRSRRSATSA